MPLNEGNWAFAMTSKSYVMRSISPALVQAVVLLLCFGSGLLLDHFLLPGPDIVVLTMVLGLTLARSRRHRGTRQRLVALATLPLVSVACVEVGRLFFQRPTLADTLFTLGIGLSIWLRRFGPWGLRIGSLLALPLVAVLVTPVPQIPAAVPTLGRSMPWSAVASVIAFLWVWIAQGLAVRIGLLPALPAEVHGANGAPTRSAARIAASDRMAAQMMLSLGIAFLVGRTFFPTHWTWIVVTAFVVNSANRGRGDVAYKSLMRIVGASVGTVATTLLTGLFPARDNTAVVIILIVLAVGSWLRTISYAYWAGCVTAVLALLQGYFGEGNLGLIGERLLQIVLGGAFSVAIAWFILPVKSGPVLRRRLADALTPLTDALVAAQRSPGELAQHERSFDAALLALRQVAPTFVAHRRIRRLIGAVGRHPADAADAVQSCAQPLSVLAEAAKQSPQTLTGPATVALLKAVTGNVLAARKSIGRRPDARYRSLNVESAAADSVAATLSRIDESMRVICDLSWDDSLRRLRSHAHRGQDAPGRDPGEAGPDHVQQDQPRGQAGEVLRVADGGLPGEHEEQVAGRAHDS